MTARARLLRRDMTDAERCLWARLRGDALGVRFRRQLVIDRRFIVDFCAPQLRLVVEVDGGQHADPAADVWRAAELERLGYRMLRFWNNEVLAETDAVVQAILTEVARLGEVAASPLSPLRGGEGKRQPGDVAPLMSDFIFPKAVL